MPYTTRTLRIGADDAGRRLDRIVRVVLRDAPLSLVYKLFRNGSVRLQGARVDASHKVSVGEVIELRLPDSSILPEHESSRAEPDSGASLAFQNMLIFETPKLAVVNKPRGVLSHGTGGVDEAARAYYSSRSAASLAFVPAPLHRLDRNSSGALAVSASLAGAVAFSEALRNGLVGKEYLAVLSGELSEEQEWMDTLDRDEATKTSVVANQGSLAIARATPVARRNGYTLVKIRLYTGRTHQIRAQAAARNLALAGDSKYGGAPLAGGYILHCAALEMPAGVASDSPARVIAPLPAHATETIIRLFGSLEGIDMSTSVKDPTRLKSAT